MNYYYTNTPTDNDSPLEVGDRVHIDDDSWGFVIRADGTTSDTATSDCSYMGKNAVLIALNCLLPQNADALQYNDGSMGREKGPDCICRHESGDVLFLRSAFLSRA